MWNDTDIPLAFFISFRCYGTWLHGDARGSIDRHNNNYGSPKYPTIKHWNQISIGRLKYDPVKLDGARRVSVEKAIRETWNKRNWQLLAINVRTNHVHTVAAIGDKKASIALNALRQTRRGRCAKMEFGEMILLRGPIKTANGIFGQRNIYSMRSIMC